MALITAYARFIVEMFESAPAAVSGLHSWNYNFRNDLSIYEFNSDVNSGLKVWAGTIALVAGTANVTLTALPRTTADRTALNLTGLTIKAIRIRNNGANAITFSNPATNGYTFFAAPPNGHPVGPGDDYMQATRRLAGFGTVGASEAIIQADGTLVQTFTMGIIAETPA